MPELIETVLKLFTGGVLVWAAIATGLFGKRKNDASASLDDSKRLIDECKYLREELNTTRGDKLKTEAENKVLKDQLLSERVDCEVQIKALRKEMEVLKETVSRQGTLINELKAKQQ